MRKFLYIMILLLVFSPFSRAEGNSLWTDEASNLFLDAKRQFTVGDVITIIIEEDASAIQSANTNVSQDSNIDAGAGTGILDFLRAFGFSYSDADSATGQTQRAGRLEADITTVVEEVLANGNLRIVGTKKIKINGEEQLIKLSGIIRPEDISQENTISSKKVAEADIQYEGQGVVTEKQKPGILSRILNWIF